MAHPARIVALLVVAALATAAAAATEEGRLWVVEGRVVDASGETLAGVLIELREPAGARWIAVADAAGRFHLRGVPLGTFELYAHFEERIVRTEAITLSPMQTTTLRLVLDDRTEVEIALRPRPVTLAPPPPPAPRPEPPSEAPPEEAAAEPAVPAAAEPTAPDAPGPTPAPAPPPEVDGPPGSASDASPAEPAEGAAVFNQRMDAELRKAWQRLDEGRVEYEPRREMTQGVGEEVRVRITPEPLEIVERLSPRSVAERLKVSGSMTAALTAAEDAFRIEPRSSERQAIVGEATDWVWWVTPLAPGDLELSLKITARIRLSNGDAAERDVLVKSAQISVQANRPWAVRTFFSRNWQWVLGGPLTLAIGGWAFARLKKRRASTPYGP